MNQEKVWDKISGKWNVYRTRVSPSVERFLEGKHGKILDLGCGSGRNFVKVDGLDWYGIDFSGEMLKFAEGKGYVELKRCGVDELPYDDDSFDVILCYAVLHCVDSAEKRLLATREVYRVLKSGGEAVISTIGKNNQRVGGKLGEGVLPWTVDSVKYMRYNYVYDLEEFEDLLKGVGLEVVKIWEDRNVNVVVRKAR